MDLLQILYFKTTDLWKLLCEQHRALYDLTVQEYAELLQSRIENVEEIGNQKLAIISIIRQLEDERQNLIGEITKHFDVNIGDAHQLLNFFADYPQEKQGKHLFKFNSFLIDVISALRDQNKKNQIFITKAIGAISEIKNVAMGVKSYSTYDARGVSSHAGTK